MLALAAIHKSENKFGLHKSENEFGLHKSENEFGLHKSENEFGLHKSENEFGSHKSEKKVAFTYFLLNYTENWQSLQMLSIIFNCTNGILLSNIPPIPFPGPMKF